jgi:hypothetical protein
MWARPIVRARAGRGDPVSAANAPDAAESLKALPLEVVEHLAQAEATLMLLECLILELIEQRVLSKQDFLNSIETVVETKRRMLEEHEHATISQVALGILSKLANSVAAGNGPAAESGGPLRR